MEGHTITPDYIFETSWEVCNKVGGIYTVLSTRALTLRQRLNDHLIFIGPLFVNGIQNDFSESGELFRPWIEAVKKDTGLQIKAGRWNVPGNPVAILVDFTPLFANRNEIYARMWEWASVDSLHGYGDYHEAGMFGFACGTVIDHFYHYNKLQGKKIVAQFHEWTTAFGLLYLKKRTPGIATIFTTHATSTGRSIAGNHKPLYDYLAGYNGDQMAAELNMQSKHSAEKQAALHADCFTTVSNITACECAQLLERRPDVVTPNGFEDDFVPQGDLFDQKRKEARTCLKQVVEALTGSPVADNALFVATGGRYEFLNKGLDVFISSLKEMNDHNPGGRPLVAFLMVPGYISGPRADLAESLHHGKSKPELHNPYVTHELVEPWHDPVLSSISWAHLTNDHTSRVRIVFVPSYLNGSDGIFDKSYYDLLIGMDLTVFASYYEPWGYTPLESAAFSVPTVTTDLSGFGQWVSPAPQDIDKGVAVIHRTDANYQEVVRGIVKQTEIMAAMNGNKTAKTRENARTIAGKALWTNFIARYDEAYTVALSKKSGAFTPAPKPDEKR
jgi:glycosyltransferase involved in cell wall biosynthesis